MHPLAHHPLRSLFTVSRARTRRASSWDRTGGNFDFITVGAGQTAMVLDVAGPGCITHVYGALAFPGITDWYQDDPHAPFPALPDRDDMRPPLGDGYEEARTLLFAAAREGFTRGPDALTALAADAAPFYAGDFTATLARLEARP